MKEYNHLRSGHFMYHPLFLMIIFMYYQCHKTNSTSHQSYHGKQIKFHRWTNGYVRNLRNVMAHAWRNMRPRWEVNVKETPERQTARCACDNRARISSGNFVNFGVFLTYKSFLVWCYTKPKALGVIILPYIKSTLKKDITIFVK